jgi:hypothetical protein
VVALLPGDGSGGALTRTGRWLGPGAIDAGDFYTGKRLQDVAAQLSQLGRCAGQHRQ